MLPNSIIVALTVKSHMPLYWENRSQFHHKENTYEDLTNCVSIALNSAR